MDKKDFYFLGKVIKTSGYKGSLVFFFDVDDIEPYKELEAVFIDVSNELIPFAIHTLQFRNSNSAFVKLEDINSDEEASALTGCELYLPVSFLPPLTGNKFYYHEIIGYEVIDEKHGKIGTMQLVIDQGPQDIMSISFKGKEILLPVTDDIIQRVDRDNKILYVSAPEGLLEIYL